MFWETVRLCKYLGTKEKMEKRGPWIVYISENTILFGSGSTDSRGLHAEHIPALLFDHAEVPSR